MAVTINADTVVGGAIVTADTSGQLALQSAGVTGLTIAGGNVTAAQKITAVGTSSTAGMKIADVLETATISATAATGTINYDVTTQAVLYYTTNASGNFVMNLRGAAGTTMNSLMATGESVTVAFLCTNGSTAYYNSSVQVDGTTTGVTTKWQGGTAPTSGNASGIDVYTYTVIKTGASTFVVLASLTQFA